MKELNIMFSKYNNSKAIPRAVANKIPGEFPVMAREKYVENLTKLDKIHLIELKEREEHLLANRSRMLKLPDKGKRIEDFYKKVCEELLHRDEIEKTSNLLSDLNISSTGQSNLNVLEWTGKLEKNVHFDSDDENDDNESIDPLKIIAQSRNLIKIKYEKPEPQLITEEDLNEIKSFEDEKISNKTESSPEKSNSSIELEPCSLYLFEKDVIISPSKMKFMPYKTTISNVHNPDKEKLRKIGGTHWEITAATPPPIRNSGAQLLSLSDSVNIQIEYINKLKKMQEIQASDRLANRVASKILLSNENVRKNKSFSKYRDVEFSDSEESSEEEVHDDEDEKGSGSFVSYSVYK